jgi:hypothetical protein
MIEIKHAVTAAIDYLVQLYDDPPGVQLEEVFRSEDDASWLVTLSFVAPVVSEELSYVQKLGMGVHSANVIRKYKALEVNGTTGEVQSMKIRPVPSV